MKHILVFAIASLFVSSTASAVPITYNLRGSGVPDGVASGSMILGGITATLTSEVLGELNQTTSGFGINALGSGDDTDAIDDGSGITEAISLYFSADVFFTGITLSIFSPGEVATLSIDGRAQPDLADTTGAGTDVFTFSSDNFVRAGQPVVLGHGNGNGFSFDSFTIETVSVPVPDGGGTVALLLAPVCGILVIARRNQN